MFYYILAIILESIDFATVVMWSIGFLVPFKYLKIKRAHLVLTWLVLVAQASFKLHCPLLVWANACRTYAGQPLINSRFQPTFLNWLSDLIGHQPAYWLTTGGIVIGPLIATALYYRFKERRRD